MNEPERSVENQEDRKGEAPVASSEAMPPKEGDAARDAKGGSAGPELRQITSLRLLETLLLFARRFGKEVSMETLTAGLPHPPHRAAPDLLDFSQAETLFTKAARRAGFRATMAQRSLDEILDLHLPVILLLEKGQSCILEALSSDRTKAKVIHPGPTPLEEWVELEELARHYTGYLFMLKKEIDDREGGTFAWHHRGKHWFWDTLKLSWPIYKDVLLASLLVNLFVLATPLFTRNVYDRVIPNNAVETLMVFAAGVLIVYLLDALLKYFRSRMLEIAAKKSDVIMSSIIFERVMDMHMSQIPRSVGSFASNLKEFDSIRGFLTNATLAVVIDLPFAVIFLLVIWYIGGIIVLVPLTIMLIILAYALFIRKPLQESIESTYEAAARKNGILIEALNNIETIKAHNIAGQIQWQWEESVGEIARKSLRSRLMSASIPTLTGFMVQLNTVLLLMVGVYMIRDQELTMGGLIAITILASRTVAPMGQVAALLTNYSDAKTAYENIDRIVNQPVERLSGHQFIHRESFRGKIEFQNVTFTYPDSEVPALKNVSFVIEPGEHVGLIGRIGSGKSTIEKLILKLYDPDEGKILIDDVDIAQIDPARLRQYIGYVGQDIGLFRGTLRDNIANRRPGIGDERLLEAAKIAGVDEFARRHPMGYNMPVGERGQGLSGGQRQSIGLARALISDAPIMLLDEPTNALDQLSESRILQALSPVLKDRTVLLITQKFALLKLTPRVIVMHEGRVYLDGPRDEVLKRLNEGAGHAS
jgi:ATP-binding cassette subfamily C protein LapB